MHAVAASGVAQRQQHLLTTEKRPYMCHTAAACVRTKKCPRKERYRHAMRHAQLPEFETPE